MTLYHRKFYKGDVPNVGDELEFDGHIVTIESFESSEAAVPMNQPLPQQLQHQSPRRLQQPLQRQQVTPPPTPIIYHPPLCTPPQEPSIPSSQSSIPSRSSRFTPPSMILKKRKIKIDPEEEEAEKDRLEPMELCEAPDQPMQDIQLEPAIPPAQVPVQPNISSITIPATTLQKRVRVGLSKRTASALHQSTCSNRMPSPVSAYSSRVMPVPVPVSSNHTMPTPVPASSSHIMPSPVPSPPVNTNTVPAK